MTAAGVNCFPALNLHLLFSVSFSPPPQAHMSRLPPPISDYVTDTRSALDNSVRLAQVGCAAAQIECDPAED